MGDPCVMCGRPLAPEDVRRCRWAWYVCSAECGQALKAKVEAQARQMQPKLYAAKDAGRELVLDPYAGDEWAIARSSLESRLTDDLTRPWRAERMRRTCEALGVALELAPALVILADRQPGCNFVDVLIEGRALHVYQGGGAKEEPPLAGYFWERVPGGWQEHRPDNDPYTRRFLSDGELRAPRYGDVEGASALSWPEHFQTTEED